MPGPGAPAAGRRLEDGDGGPLAARPPAPGPAAEARAASSSAADARQDSSTVDRPEVADAEDLPRQRALAAGEDEVAGA